MVGKTPRWESELWSYVCSGDGMHCPLYDYCQNRQGGGWCPSDNAERLDRLLDEKRFDFTNFNFIKRGECGKIGRMVERLAQSYLRKNGVHCPPVPIELISWLDIGHAVEIRTVPLKSYHGAIWRIGDRWVIQLKDDATSASKRFTLFHEAFHILAHCKTIPVFRKRGTKVGSFNEGLATHFATCILMPRQWLKEKWVEVEDLDRMAEIFDVPKSAMCIRLKRLGLI